MVGQCILINFLPTSLSITHSSVWPSSPIGAISILCTYLLFSFLLCIWRAWAGEEGGQVEGRWAEDGRRGGGGAGLSFPRHSHLTHGGWQAGSHHLCLSSDSVAFTLPGRPFSMPPFGLSLSHTLSFFWQAGAGDSSGVVWWRMAYSLSLGRAEKGRRRATAAEKVVVFHPGRTGRAGWAVGRASLLTHT